jgi:sugar phosphate isomerase/epimerase
MKTIQGPAIFLAQYMGDEPPFDDIDTAAKWAAGLGFKGLQIPTWDSRAIDLDQAAESKSYCEDWQAKLAAHGISTPGRRGPRAWWKKLLPNSPADGNRC